MHHLGLTLSNIYAFYSRNECTDHGKEAQVKDLIHLLQTFYYINRRYLSDILPLRCKKIPINQSLYTH